MIYFYNWSYDEKDDSFLAYVDDGSRSGDPIFTIDDTEEICDYIKCGRMNHIDDTEGLEDFLKEQGFLQDEDSILFRERMIW
jgi:hypothetical protein